MLVTVPHVATEGKDIRVMVTHTRPGEKPMWFPVAAADSSPGSVTVRLPFLGVVAVCQAQEFVKQALHGQRLSQPVDVATSARRPSVGSKVVEAFEARGAILLSCYNGVATGAAAKVKARVNQLYQALRKRGYNVWLDNDPHITQGCLDHRMVEAIQHCALVLACLTPEYDLEDTDSRRQLEYALLLRKPVIGVTLTERPPSQDTLFNRYFGDMAIFDASNDATLSENVQQICQSLGSIARRMESDA